jgi:replicative DNA helicase
MSDLRESGSIEQDADVVAFIYREDYYQIGRGNSEERRNIAEIIIAKQRNGPTDTIKLAFLKQFTRFEDAMLFRKVGEYEYSNHREGPALSRRQI